MLILTEDPTQEEMIKWNSLADHELFDDPKTEFVSSLKPDTEQLELAI